jgi:hypothetical protein
VRTRFGIEIANFEQMSPAEQGRAIGELRGNLQAEAIKIVAGGAAGRLASGGRLAGAASTATAAESAAARTLVLEARTGARVDTPSTRPDITTPGVDRTPDTGSNSPAQTGNGSANGDTNTVGTNGTRPAPNAPPPPPPRIEQVNVDNVRPGTREYDLLNSPPPNTRIELSNGNVYVTNAQGIVDEVSFQPRLVTGTRDARQTAVGRQGLDTDVGGHIQACSLGGTCDRVNLFPQDRRFNNSEYKVFENEIRRALDAGESVGPVTVRFVRPDPANPRPSGVNVTYTIGGRTRTIPFENQARVGP